MTTTFDARVAAAMKIEAQQFTAGDLHLIGAHELPTHVEGDTGLIITYQRVLDLRDTTGERGLMNETRWVVVPGAAAGRTSRTSGTLATTWTDRA